jgi:hypothetical protein
LDQKTTRLRNVFFTLFFLLAAATNIHSLKILNPKNFRPNPHLPAIREVLSKIPPQAGVSCPDLYLSPLSNRRALDWLGHENYKRSYEYLLLDLNREDNEHIEWPVVQNYWKAASQSPDYELLFDKDNIKLYRNKRFSPSRQG